ncbi:MAG TPA: PQQ-binding-like beta-propeller repeat protein [Planctomycetota bacterium]|nr:PQQ-binding-like beta-propeller repeat protein [Planctomycetota bacterium]
MTVSRKQVMLTASLCLALLATRPLWSAEDNWPQFRGPTGLGYTRETNLPITWGGPKDENVRWKSPLVGQGHASPVVWGNRLFVCTVRWPESDRPREKVMPEHHVLCYDTADGKLLWDTQVPPGPWLRNDFRSGPGGGYACPTPPTDGKLVYCAFGSQVLAALDYEGKVAWRRELKPGDFDVTVGSSAILYQDTLIFAYETRRPEDARVAAYDKATGEVKWEAKYPTMVMAHSTPTIIEVKGKPQMLILAGGLGRVSDALRSLDPATGKTLWWCGGAGESSSPAYGAGIVYFDNGRGGPGAAVDPTGEGDVTQTHIKWKVSTGGGLSSPLIVGDHVYRLYDSGTLKCWEAATGKEVYSKHLDGISSGWASPIADPNGHIFFANAGKSFVVKAGPEFEVLATNDLGDGSHPSPAVAGGRIFLVGLKSVFCIGR